MKRISIIALCAAAVVAAACQKEIDIPEVSVTPASEPAELELNIEVIMQQLEATKVHKTDWEVGDNLYIIFDKTVTDKYLNIYYTRNWSEGYNYWEAYWTDGLAAEIVEKGSGTLSAFYVPFWKTIGLYPHYDETHHVIRPEDKIWRPSEEPQPTGKPVFSFYMTCDDVPYIVSDGKLSATLNMAPPAEHNFVHFFLPGNYDSDPRQFILTVVPLDDTYAIDWGKAMTSVTLSGYYPGTGFTTTRRANIPGYYYQGGVSFCGTLDPSLVDVQRDYLLYISHNNNTPYDTSDDVVYYTFHGGKTLRAGSTVELSPLQYWAERSSIQAIPMYKNDEGETVCFADRNLFADEDDYGEVGVRGIYTAWGGWAGTTAWNLESYWFNWNNYPYGDGTSFTKYSQADGPWALEEEDDAAKMFHGYAWSTPTTEEWLDLVNLCDWTWKDISAEPFTGYYGYIVTGRGEFSSSSIFLPAVDFIGYDENNSWTYTGSFGQEACGAYWAKDLASDEFGSCFTFMANSLPHTVKSWMKNCGFCVRPVMVIK